jgi:hypothetical protein
MTQHRTILASEAQELLSWATPGPWEIREKPWQNEVSIDTNQWEPRLQYRGWEGFISVYGCDDLPHLGRTVARANAALVAAAPDLAATVVALYAKVEEEKARADKAEANYRWMVERAADQRLDGYRELAAKCAALEAQKDQLQLLVDEAYDIIIGQDNPAWSGWCDRAVEADDRGVE